MENGGENVQQQQQALLEAIKEGNLKFIQTLSQGKSENDLKKLFGPTPEGMTPLIAAVLHDQAEVAIYLVKSCSADIDLKGSAEISDLDEMVHGATALWFAAERGNLDMVECLISRSADVNSQTDSLSTPLCAAVIGGHYKVVQYLVENGSNVNMGNKTGNTPLHISSARNRPEILRYLLKNGAKITRNVKGRTPIHVACIGGSLEVIPILILNSDDTDINAIDCDGNTPLNLTAGQNYLKPSLLLLENGAKQLPNRNQLTPLLMAASHGSLDLVKALLQYNGEQHANQPGSDPMQFLNITPLQGAAALAHEEIVLYMLDKCRGRVSQETYVETLELLGAGCLQRNKKEEAVRFWKEAIRIRKKYSVTLEKPNSASIIYKCTGYHEVEKATELNSIKDADSKMNAQAALIFDRIVGPASGKNTIHPQTAVAISRVGFRLADEGKFRGSIRILEYAFTCLLELDDPFYVTIVEYCHNFAKVYKEALQKDNSRSPKQVQFEHILHTQKRILDLLKRGRRVLDDKEIIWNSSQDHKERITKHHHYMVISLLQLISLTCGMLEDRATQSQEEDFRKLVKEAVDLDLRGGFDQTLMELARSDIASLLQLKDGDRFPIVEFPCVMTVSLLESLGAQST